MKDNKYLTVKRIKGLIPAFFTDHVLAPTTQTSLNSLPNGTFLDWTKIRALADDKLNVAQMMISVFVRVENIEGK